MTFEGVITRGVDDEESSVDLAPFLDAYLEPFEAAYPGVDLRAAVPRAAARLGVPGPRRARAGRGRGDPDPGGMFLDGRP